MAYTADLKFCKDVGHCDCERVEPSAIHRSGVFEYAGVVAETFVVAVELDGVVYLVFVFGGAATVVADERKHCRCNCYCNDYEYYPMEFFVHFVCVSKVVQR